MKRSNAPIFWALFGAGGMLSALVGAMLVWISGIAAPLGLGLPAATLSYANALAVASSWPGRLTIFIVISLFLWHAAHRIFHTLHDLGIQAGLLARLLCYGSAMAGTLAALAALAAIG
ncbi:MAG: fumarate reductase subunit FrdD [Rhodanobacteraceae bacterium]|nr:fumarate reductase subunit FrdD [Rhodanobacteraceae bacterium]